MNPETLDQMDFEEQKKILTDISTEIIRLLIEDHVIRVESDDAERRIRIMVMDQVFCVTVTAE